MFGYILAGLLLLALLPDKNGQESSRNDIEEVRKNLRKSEFNNWETQEIARRLRTDSDFKWQHEKNLRRGVRYEDSIRELMRDEH